MFLLHGKRFIQKAVSFSKAIFISFGSALNSKTLVVEQAHFTFLMFLSMSPKWTFALMTWRSKSSSLSSWSFKGRDSISVHKYLTGTRQCLCKDITLLRAVHKLCAVQEVIMSLTLTLTLYIHEHNISK